MPDLKTEMSKVLNEWENHEQSIRTPKKMANGRVVFTVTNNVSRETFNHVKANPNITSAQACAVLEKRGFKESSVGSLLVQFVKQGMMSRDESGRYKTIVPEYTPLKSNKATKAARAVQPPKRKVGRPKGTSMGIAALKAEFIIDHYMEARRAERHWLVMYFAWVTAVTLLLVWGHTAAPG